MRMRIMNSKQLLNYDTEHAFNSEQLPPLLCVFTNQIFKLLEPQILVTMKAVTILSFRTQ